MPVHQMTRNASENRYLHRDFHNILSLGLDYLHDHFGPGAVVEYLQSFAIHFYAPLIDAMRRNPFEAIVESFVKTYREEEASDLLEFERNERELFVRIRHCPALAHIRGSNMTPSRFFSLTSSVVWETISREAGIGYAMLSYDRENGGAEHLFFLPEHERIENGRLRKETP